MDKSSLLCEARAELDFLVRNRRFLHEHAETGFELKNTVFHVKLELEKLGYVSQDCGNCGIIAEIGEGDGCILLRADMDALPIREEAELGFASKNGNMHACGHDMHTSMLLGAAKLLKAHEKELKCRVRLMFQPAEEILSGALSMIESGVLDSVRAAMMIHVASGIDLPSGCVIIPDSGVGAPSADHFELEIFGKGAHGATPNLGADAILTGAHILLGFSTLCSRELSLAQRAILTVGRFEGGASPNAIADRATLFGTFRTFEEDVRSHLKERMEQIAHLTAEAHRTKAFLNFTSGCPSFSNSEEAIKRAKACALHLLDKEAVLSPGDHGASAVGGSEDFAYVSRRVPTVVVSLTAGEKKKGYEYPLHHPKVNFDESALPVGAALLAAFALEN